MDALAKPGLGSTSASSAIIRFHYESFESAAMAWDSYGAWRDWPSEIGGVDPDGMPRLQETGALMLGSANEFSSMVENLRRLDISHEVLSPDDIRHRFPAIDPARFGPPRPVDDPAFWADPSGEDLSGLYTPDGGYVTDPQRAAATYAWAADREGVQFLMKRRVSAIVSSGERISGVRLGDGAVVEADVVVNAAGPTSSQINSMAGLDTSVGVISRPLITETHVVPAPPNFQGGTSVFVIDPDLGIAFRPEGDHEVLVSCVEPECDPLEWCLDPWNLDPRPTQEVYERQTLRTARRLPDLRIPPRPRGLRALYDVSSDWNPLLGQTPVDGFVVACGTSGNSFKTAPAISLLVASVVEAQLQGTEAPRMLTLPRTGVAIAIDAYALSRRSGSARNVIT